MLLHGYHANGGSGLPEDEGGSEKRCGEAAGRSAGKDSLSEGLIRGKGKMVIFSMSNHSENDTNIKISTRRRSERGFHLKRSYSCGVMRC